jgi:hypothetical protein
MNTAGTPPDRPATPVDRRTANVPYTGPDRRKVNLPPAEWNSTVQELMEHVEEQREARPAPPVHRSWQPVILSALAVILCAVGAWNIVSWQEAGRPAFSQQAVADGVRATMFMTVVDLEEHRSRTGDYPRTLEEAGFHHPDLVYRRTGEGFVLEGQTLTTPIVYVSGQDLSRFQQSLNLVLVASGDDS